MSTLKWLKTNNPLYEDILIDCTSIGVELTCMGHNENDDTSLQRNIFTNNIENTYKCASHPGDTNILKYSELRKIT